MTYTSFYYAIFVGVLFALYYILPKKCQWPILLAGSAFFYVVAAKAYSVFILATIITIYFAANMIQRINEETSKTVKENKEVWTRDERKAFRARSEKKTRFVLIVTLIINFGILFTIKYFGASLGGILLPLGISFYTFQSTGYLIDVYRENIEAEKNPFKLALFISFFPQILQGPIGEFSKLQNGLFSEKSLSWNNFKYGFETIVWGLFKKLIVADRAVIIINNYLSNGGTEKHPHEGPYGGTAVLFVVLIYAIQLYADFSGGIDISRGVSRLFGVELAQNFRQPYFATTLGDYWRRWHITLGAWMKKYIFFSLAASDPFLKLGKKVNKTFPAALATFIVFIFVGAWHGSNMKYIAFGIWNGLVLMISMLLEDRLIGLREKLHIKATAWWYHLFRMVRTFILVLIGYYFDVATSIGDSFDMMARTLTGQSMSVFLTEWRSLGLRGLEYIALGFGILAMLYIDIRLETTKEDDACKLLGRHGGVIEWILLFLAIATIVVLGVYGPGYDPADFVYMQF